MGYLNFDKKNYGYCKCIIRGRKAWNVRFLTCLETKDAHIFLKKS